MGAGAAETGGSSVEVSVAARVQGQPVSVPDVYVALVPSDHPSTRPVREVVSEKGANWPDVEPGHYGLIVQAGGFEPVMRKLDIHPGRRERVSVDLEQQFELTGTVVDDRGTPIAGATVGLSVGVAPASVSVMSELALRTLADRLRTTTDQNGWWKLAVPSARTTLLLVQAPGYAPAWVESEPGTAELPPTALRKGTSLRVTTDRAAPEITLSLEPVGALETSVPEAWHERVWSREAAATALEWSSLPAGEYDLVANWHDPNRFAAPRTIQRVKLAAGAGQDVRVTLPESPAPASSSVRVRIPFRTAINGLRAYLRSDSGAKEVPSTFENVLSGKVLYAKADTDPENVFFTTDAEVILGVPRKLGHDSAPEAIKFPRATGALTVGVAERLALPTHGIAHFGECTGEKSYTLPVNVKKNGDVVLPLLVGCEALTMRFGTFAPLALRAVARAREDVALGRHQLKAAVSAQVHVVNETSKTNGARALVTASVKRGPETVPVASQVAGEDGWAVLEGLPAGEELTFRAEDTTTKLAGTVVQVLEAEKAAVIDPLLLPEAASLTILPRFDEDFHNVNPDAELVAVIAQLEVEGDEKTERRTVNPTTEDPKAEFHGLRSGTWWILAIVRLGGVAQPVEVQSVELEAGDRKTIEPVIRPLVVSGHLLSGGSGVEASIAFTDPPGPSAITRRVRSNKDGSFRTMLPREGYYTVAARRVLADPDTELGPIRFDSSSTNVRLELPEGSLAVRVFDGGMPAADAQVTASLIGQSPEQGRLLRLERKARTGISGEVLIGELQDGTWLVTARGKGEAIAEKTVVVSAKEAASVSLDLDGGTALKGVVVDGAGNPAALAAVDCIYSGKDNFPRIVYAEADSRGAFSIAIPRPAPERLQCGVTAADGAIGTFTTGPVSDARFMLPPATSTVTLTNWSDRGNRSRFWLVGADGGLFDVSWAARKLRKQDGPFTIPRVPAGAWSVVRVDTPAAFEALARGGAAVLPKIARFSVAPGQPQEISMSGGDSAGSRTGSTK